MPKKERSEYEYEWFLYEVGGSFSRDEERMKVLDRHCKLSY